jgi:putative peptide zinc metalloprotease protein
MQIFPSAIDDIQCEVLFRKRSKTIYCVGSVEIDSYIFVDEQEKDAIITALNYMNGERTLEEVRDLLINEHNIKIDSASLYSLCVENKFIKNIDPDIIPAKKGFNELDIFMIDLFSISLDRFCGTFAFLSRHLRTIVTLMALIVIALLGLLHLSSIDKDFSFSLAPLLSNPITIVFYVMVSTISVILHELSHIVVAYRYGVIPKNLTVALYAYITPMFYVRLNGIYMIEPMKRIAIWAAGSLMNFFIAFICFSLIGFTTGLLNLFVVTGLVCNLILGVTSLLPIFITDGYYILATILKTPNLRKNSFSQSFKLLKGNFNKESLIYVVYCVVFVGLIIYFLVLQIGIIVTTIIQETNSGLSIFQIIKNYMTIVVFACIGIVSKTISVIRKRHADGTK